MTRTIDAFYAAASDANPAFFEVEQGLARLEDYDLPVASERKLTDMFRKGNLAEKLFAKLQTTGFNGDGSEAERLLARYI